MLDMISAGGFSLLGDQIPHCSWQDSSWEVSKHKGPSPSISSNSNIFRCQYPGCMVSVLKICLHGWDMQWEGVLLPSSQI